MNITDVDATLDVAYDDLRQETDFLTSDQLL